MTLALAFTFGGLLLVLLWARIRREGEKHEAAMADWHLRRVVDRARRTALRDRGIALFSDYQPGKYVPNEFGEAARPEGTLSNWDTSLHHGSRH